MCYSLLPSKTKSNKKLSPYLVKVFYYKIPKVMFPGSSTLSGLRGLLCLHIMVSHYILWSQSVLLGLTINLNAPVEMPLFFLLSGFTLALSNYPEADQHSSIGCLKFYRNRFARLAPLYYVSNMISLCLPSRGGVAW